MSDQVTFIQPIKRGRRKINKPKTIVDNLRRLSEWYAANKPDLRSMTISKDDAYGLRQLWNKRDAKTDGQAELRSQGFHITPDGQISWQSFTLIEQQ